MELEDVYFGAEVFEMDLWRIFKKFMKNTK